MQLTVAGIVLSRPLYLSSCHGVQMPAPPPLSTLANAAVASIGLISLCNDRSIQTMRAELHNSPFFNFFASDLLLARFPSKLFV